MTIYTECKGKIFELPLTHSSEKRKGFLFYIKNQEGKKIYGEISPLPHFSFETLDEAILQFNHFSHRLLNGTWTEQDLDALYPSVAFGLESALYPSSQTIQCPIAVLLQGSCKEIELKAKQAIDEGIKIAKLKVSQLSFQDAKTLIDQFKNHLLLRIDVNRQWTLKEVLHFFSEYDPKDFDYIEEPLHPFSDLIHFTHPFALDESLREFPVHQWSHLPHLNALILKPSLMGNLSKITPLLSLKKRIILSSAFESGVGILQIVALGNRLSLLQEPLGIDTYRYLKEDLLQKKLHFSKGYLQCCLTPQVNPQFL